MPNDHDNDEMDLVETARKSLAAGALDGEARTNLAELLNRYETLLAENQRLVRISDQIITDRATEANIDRQTGVFNRSHFVRIAERELERAIRFERPMSILLIRIDGLQALHEKFGDPARDAALKSLAAAGLGVLRRIDSFARAADDSFAALLPETDTTGAVILAERLRDAVAKMGVAVGEEAIEFTVSIGVSSRLEEGDRADAMLQRAGDAVAPDGVDRHDRVAVAT